MKNQAPPGISEFRLAESTKPGYRCSEVDSYFNKLADDFEAIRSGRPYLGITTSDDIRANCFTAVKGGYLPEDVDQALDRVEDRFAEFERARVLDAGENAAWKETIEAEARLIMGRLNRPAGQRFRRPSKKLTKGYYTADVDALCDRLRRHFRESDTLSASLVRGSSFRLSTGNTCYEETQVDAFLDRCVKLILDLR